MDITQRFNNKVVREESCWRWTASMTPNGYGKFFVNGRCIGAHRVAYWLHHGRWPENMALHRCGNRWCVNPDHIYDGDSRANYIDSLGHGTAVHGEDHAMAKLRANDVRRIRKLLAGEPATQAEIARSFGVTDQLIYAIKRGRAWAQLDDE